MADIGSVIDGKYEILKLVGKGGMSSVYLSMDKRLNKQWAVKEIPKNARDKNNAVIIQSAIAEANLIKRLDHPTLPRIVDIIDTGLDIYIIMDYIEGEPLNRVLEQYGAQPQDLVFEWGKQLCEVLEYLHTRKPPIIYRDMKPANVMLTPEGNVKLIDFGIAREFKEQNLADTVCLGTRGYAAPEQFGGRGQTDARTDVYGLGVTLYHMITGHNPSEPPYELYPIRHWNPALSEGLERIIQKCTQLNPAERYQSCAELLYALNNPDDPTIRRLQKRKLYTFIGVAAASALFLLAGIFGQVMKEQTNNADYNNNIRLAERASSDDEKVAYYSHAIQIKPGEIEPYMEMVRALGRNGFTAEENEVFTIVIQKNLNVIQANPKYGDLAFEIGKLYWYYYSPGDSQNQAQPANDSLPAMNFAGMTSAIKWFDDAVAYGTSDAGRREMAELYSQIGKFKRDIDQAVEEANTKGKYQEFFGYMQQLAGLTQTGREESTEEIIQIWNYRFIITSIETYARKFKNDGVSQSDLQQLFDAVSRRIRAFDTSGIEDKTRLIYEYLLKRLGNSQNKGEVQMAIDNAYRS